MSASTGPQYLRDVAMGLRRMGFPISAPSLEQMAAQWEADIARADELGRRLSSKTMALQEAEESVDRLQATKKYLTAEIKGLYAEREASFESLRRSYDEGTNKLHAALERAANDLMLSEESFVKMRDKRDDVLRELHAKSAALEHANRFLEQETFTRQKYGDQLHATEAALEQAQTQVALYEGRHPAQLGPDGQEVAPRHRYTDEGVCIRCGEDAEEWDAGCVEELAAELEKKAAALERARAVERQLRIASDDPRASYETSRAYERAANDLEAALGVAPVSAQTCQECGHLESEHRSVAGGLGFACRHAGCDCIKQAAAPGGAA